jgi:hypothetical protein
MPQIVLNASVDYAGNSTTIVKTIEYLNVPVSGDGVNTLSSFAATTSAVAIPLGSAANPLGWLFIKNNDVSNFIQVLTGTSGTVFGKLFPGEFLLMRLDPTITAPAVQADTANCSISFCIIDN